MLIKVLLTNVWGEGTLPIISVIAVSLFGLCGCSPTSSVDGKMPETLRTASWLKVIIF